MNPLFNDLRCVIGFETDSDLFAYSRVSKLFAPGEKDPFLPTLTVHLRINLHPHESSAALYP